MIRTLSCLFIGAACVSAQAPAPLKLNVPKDHPRIGFAAADVEKVRANIQKEPWAGLWKAVVSRSEGVQRGARFGIIRFGSRVDVYLPPGTEILVTPGITTVAGETVLARFR